MLCCHYKSSSQTERSFPAPTSHLYALSVRPACTPCLYALALCPASTPYIYALPLRPASMPCLYALPLCSASTPFITSCLYALPLPPVSTPYLYALPLHPTSMPCLYASLLCGVFYIYTGFLAVPCCSNLALKLGFISSRLVNVSTLLFHSHLSKLSLDNNAIGRCYSESGHFHCPTAKYCLSNLFPRHLCSCIAR